MKRENLRWFLIRRFLLILLFVAVSEALLNLLYSRAVYPWLTDTMKIDLFMNRVSTGGTIAALGQGMIWLLCTSISGYFPSVSGIRIREEVNRWMGENLVNQMASQTRNMTESEKNFYFIGIAAVCLLLLLVTLLPYIAAAVVFSQMVAVQVKRLEQEEEAHRKAYDRQRNLLLSDMAHDLKTPMTAVSGYARALAEGAVAEEEKQKEYLNVIYSKSMQMSGLISLLFEYVKLDSEGFALKKTREDLTELLRESVAALYTDFEEKQMEVAAELQEEPYFAMVDRIQFQRVIQNLLTNAIRHNPEKTRVWVRLDAEEGKISICDDGAPISEEMAETLFEPFVLGDESRNSKNGSGLGLSIASKVAEMHGWSLALEQENGTEYQKAFVIKLGQQET